MYNIVAVSVSKQNTAALNHIELLSKASLPKALVKHISVQYQITGSQAVEVAKQDLSPGSTVSA